MSMTMKSVILLTILATNIFVSSQSDDPYRVELLDPRGFRVLRPRMTDLIGIDFYEGYISSRIKRPDNAISSGYFNQRSDGWWVYEVTNSTLNPGDTLSYTIGEYTESCGVMYDKEFNVSLDAPRVLV